MRMKEVIQSQNVRKKAQLGVMPTVIGAIFALGPQGLIGAYGVTESILILGALIVAQIYLIAARIQFDFRQAT